jgi:amidase
MTELWRLGAADIATRVANREISATEVTEHSLQRLQAVNPAINAVVQQMPEAALAAARAVDDSIADGRSPGKLAGVPTAYAFNRITLPSRTARS